MVEKFGDNINVCTWLDLVIVLMVKLPVKYVGFVKCTLVTP